MTSLSDTGAGIREPAFRAAVAAIRAGKSVELIGTRASGRTTFLNRIAAALADDDWQILRVTGVASLRQHPLGALLVAGLLGGGQSRSGPPSRSLVAEELAERITRRSVIMVDGWDELDESTWGVLVSLHARFAVPLVAVRLACQYAKRTPTGVGATGLAMPLAIEMSPVVYEDVRRLVEEVLDGPAAPELVGDVFVQTGGHIGMAVALLEHAVREQSVERHGGLWTQARPLYGPSLRWWFESMLGGLSDEDRDLLDMLALTKRMSLATMRDLVAAQAIEEVERRGLVQVVGTGDRMLVVHPPVLTHFLAQSVSDMKRIRIAERLAGLPGVEFATDEPGVRRVSVDRAPVLAAVMTARLQTERADARTRWRAEPSVANATAYLRALMRDRATTAEFEEVLEHTDADDDAATGMVGLEYLIAQADWLAFREGDLAAAIGRLQAVAAEDSEAGRFARAKVVQLSVMLGTVPPDYETALVADAHSSAQVRGAVEAALALAHLASGRLRRAEFHAARIPDVEIPHLGIDIGLLRGLIQLHGGRIREGVRSASESYRNAAERFDPEALRAFGWMYARTLIHMRDLGDIEDVLTVTAGVPETPSRGVYQLGLLSNAVVVALTRSRPDLARKYIAEMDRMPTPDGPFPGQQRGLSRARLQMYEGRVEEGVQTLRDMADDLWARGLRVAAVQAYLHAHEVLSQPEHFVSDMEKFAQVEGRLIGLHVDSFKAVIDGDAARLSEIADELVDNGLLVWALTSLQRAADLVKGADGASHDLQIEARIAAIRAQLPARLTLSTRRMLLRTQLTAREMEFARHVASGASNAEIAARMVVSKRTVESAVARIARKLGVRSRSGVTEWVRAHDPETPSAPARVAGMGRAG